MKKLDKNVLLETNVEEERRLLYVAMTRVEERLYIGHKDSKFIKELKDRKQVVSKEGVDIVYTLMNHEFHSLWCWDEIMAVHTDSIKSAPNIELHINKGVINRRFIFSKEDVNKVIDLIESVKTNITVTEVNHNE